MRTYRGFLRQAHGSTVNLLSLGDYVKGVVPREVPTSWRNAAIRAQGVAARTYAAWSRSQRSRSWWHICDTSHCQVYGGVDAEDARVNGLLDLTPDEVRLAGGSPAFTQFSASNGGWTAAGSAPYLVARSDPYDAYPGWQAQVSTAPLAAAHPEVGALQQVRVLDRDGNGAWGGRVTQFQLRGSRDTVTISGDEVRSLLGLRSTLFRLL